MVSLTAVASLEHVGTEDEIVAASCARGKPAPEAAMTVPQRRRCVSRCQGTGQHDQHDLKKHLKTEILGLVYHLPQF